MRSVFDKITMKFCRELFSSHLEQQRIGIDTRKNTKAVADAGGRRT